MRQLTLVALPTNQAGRQLGGPDPGGDAAGVSQIVRLAAQRRVLTPCTLSAVQGAAVQPAAATELDVLATPAPSAAYVVDDANLLSRAAYGELNQLGKDLEDKTGYRVNVVTLRKLQFETDVFAFADKVIERWYPTAQLGDKKAVLLLVKGSKEGALVTGPAMGKALGGPLVDSIIGDNIPVLAEQEKYGEALISSVKRITAKLEGQADPGAPQVATRKTGSNFKTKGETDDKKGTYTAIVGGLLVISFVVPMVQYFGYIQKD